MCALSFVCMYALMYSMVDRLDNVYPNLNQFYMAGLMTAPMAMLELALMGKMYPDNEAVDSRPDRSASTRDRATGGLDP